MEQGGGDVHGGRAGVLLGDASGGVGEELLQPVADPGEQLPVALQQRRWVRVASRVPQEAPEGASLQPQVPQRPDIKPAGVGQPEHRGVDPAGAGTRQHVDGGGHVDQVEQLPVQIADLQGEAADGRPTRWGGRRLAHIAVPEVAGLCEQVDLASDAPHPHREADPTGHGDGQSHLLGGEGNLGGACLTVHTTPPGLTPPTATRQASMNH